MVRFLAIGMVVLRQMECFNCGNQAFIIEGKKKLKVDGNPHSRRFEVYRCAFCRRYMIIEVTER